MLGDPLFKENGFSQQTTFHAKNSIFSFQAFYLRMDGLNIAIRILANIIFFIWISREEKRIKKSELAKKLYDKMKARITEKREEIERFQKPR